MRICHIITGLVTGGAERMLLKLLSATDRSRFTPLVISLLDEGAIGPDIRALGVPLLTLNMSRRVPHPAALLRLRDGIRSFEPDVIQGWMYHGNLAASLASRLVPDRPPVVWNIRQSLYDIQAEKPVTRWVIRLSARLSVHPAAIIHNSQTGAAQHARSGFSTRRSLLIPNGFDTEVFKPSADGRQRLRHQLGVREDEFLLGLAARYHPMKDIGNFLQAAARLTRGGYAARLVLAGPGMTTDNPALMRQIGDLQLESRVIPMGTVGNMPLFFQGLDLATLSSIRGEGFPNVLGEAMACGVPCVATDVGDVRHILGDTGTLVPPAAPDALADAWSSWIKAGPNWRSQQGQQARQHITRQYALSAIVQSYEALYCRLVTDRQT